MLMVCTAIGYDGNNNILFYALNHISEARAKSKEPFLVPLQMNGCIVHNLDIWSKDTLKECIANESMFVYNLSLGSDNKLYEREKEKFPITHITSDKIELGREYKAIYHYRDVDGGDIGYVLVDRRNHQHLVGTDELKSGLKSRGLQVLNMRLTLHGELEHKKDKETKTEEQKEIELFQKNMKRMSTFLISRGYKLSNSKISLNKMKIITTINGSNYEFALVDKDTDYMCDISVFKKLKEGYTGSSMSNNPEDFETDLEHTLIPLINGEYD